MWSYASHKKQIKENIFIVFFIIYIFYKVMFGKTILSQKTSCPNIPIGVFVKYTLKINIILVLQVHH